MVHSDKNTLGIKVLTVGLVAIACPLLYYGSAMLLFVPGYTGESYFASGRMIYGAFPTLVSVALLVLAGWLWSRAVGVEEWSQFVARAFSWAFGAVAAFWIGLILISWFR